MSNYKRLPAVFSLLSIFTVGSSLAQDQEQSEVVIKERAVLEEIVVTAERRESSLQSTPIAVTVMSQKALTENDISDVTDLSGFVPNLVVSGQEDQSDIKIFIRGVGTNNPTETGDQGVGVYVDGVYAARAQGALALMYDLENVQVLRGPQGTLFGRNNTGGALLLQTKKPRGEFEADAQFSTGSNNRQQISGGFTVPLTDTFGIRIAGYSDTNDGWVDALSQDPRGEEHSYSGIAGRTAITDSPLNNTEVSSARITSVWEPSDRLSLTAQFETFSDKGNGGILLNPVDVEAGRHEAFIDSPIFLDLTSDVFRSTVSYDVTDSINLEYILGSADLSRKQVVDQDAGVTSRFQEARTEYQNTISNSHEIKLQNVGDERLSWTTGLYYFREETAIRFDFDGQGAWLQGGATFIQPARGAESASAYGQLNYDLTDNLVLTGGVRYTDDLKYDRGGRNVMDCENEFIQPTLGGSNLSVYEDFLDNRSGAEGADGLDDFTGRERVRSQCAATLRNDVEAENSELTYLGRVSYEWDDRMLYASVGTGYRAGEIQDGGDVTNPENSVSYEVGYKFDTDYVRFNAAGFYIDYTDLIRAGFDEDKNQIVTSNVAGAEIKGLEAEITWLIGEGGAFEFGGGYLDAKYTDYLVDSSGFGTNIPPILDEGGEPTGFYSLAGNTMPQSPEFSFNSTLRWEFATENGYISPRINVRYVDTVFFRDHNENGAEINNLVGDVQQTGYFNGNPAGQDAHTKVNLGIKYSSLDDDWQVDLFVNNATDEMTKSSSSVDNNTSAGFPGRYASPRTWGIRLNMNF
ncbi:MAG: TonB-dependent receptor [Porticoccaceae bacterium]|nr:TonB-dependent receptor [Porticoccaceae bacterium]